MLPAGYNSTMGREPAGLLVGKQAAGLLMYRRRQGSIEVLLIHPGGPFWTNKDLGAWSIPKGEYPPQEDPLSAATREFQEETGFPVPARSEYEFTPLTSIKQPGGKLVHAWAFEGDANPAQVKSNSFEQEWPPRSGRRQTFPEVDKAGWFTLEEARRRISKGQVPLIEELERLLTTKGPTPACDISKNR
jgi:predicted NUDIX family NTP pyrophosphohydrolase